MKKFFRIFRGTVKEKIEAEQKTSFKEALKDRYLTFQDLLRENNYVLGLMADMEEKLSGEYLFDRHYININVKLIADGVLKIIKHLNVISKDKYKQLYNQYHDIKKEIDKTLTYKLEIPDSELTIPIENITKEMSRITGGKIAHLGEIKKRLNLPTPAGFSITASGFKRFMGHNRFAEEINKRLSTLTIDNMEELNKVSRQIQDMIIEAEIPEDLLNAIEKEVEELKERRGETETRRNGEIENLPSHRVAVSPCRPFTVSVRSSAIHEDGEHTFAGQYSTSLNVHEDSILQKYKEVVASLFTPRAIFYYKTRGFSEEEMIMAVGVLKMVDARTGGVMYTGDPNNPERDVVIINAVWGLGAAAVDGSVIPDSYIVSKKSGDILERKPGGQPTVIILAPEGDIKEISVSEEIKGKLCLTDEQINILSNYASALENHYGRPQDIEWTIGRDNQIYILQSRPLQMFNVQSSKSTVPRRIDGYNILIDRGVIACKGIACGKVFLLKDEKDLRDFPEGAVLVARHTSPKYVTVMEKASAIITDVGSATGHMASLSREYQVPTILDTEMATSIIKDGQEITVDAVNCNIYDGRVNKLLEYAVKKKEPFKDTHLFMTLEKALKWIVPLDLVDPDNEDFRPEHCKTFHDITRFAHEMAMAEIFKTGKGHEIESFEDLLSAAAFAEEGDTKEIDLQAIVLKAGIPVDARLIDIDGGIKSHLKKATPDDILSIPFSAFLKGLTNMRWPGPRPADVKGFMGMVAHTASIPEAELYKIAEKSYAIISSNYMTFSIRLGYHFSMVEAYAGENLNDNYIKFFFKGGGAVVDRRLRRVRLIKEILKKMDFKVNVTGDVIDAMLTKYKQSDIEKKLEIMGKLTAYTKQLDMVMYNDAITDWYIEEFIKDHIK